MTYGRETRDTKKAVRERVNVLYSVLHEGTGWRGCLRTTAVSEMFNLFYIIVLVKMGFVTAALRT
jgi:hypothetical protein